MDGRYEKRDDETYFDYKARLIKYRLEDKDDIEWEDIVNLLGLQCSSEHLRKTSYGFLEAYNHLSFNKCDECNRHNTSDLDLKIVDLKKERYKLQTEKLELNRMIREQARTELYLEKITNAIKSIEPLEIKPPRIYDDNCVKEGLLCISDIHFGKQVEIKGLDGNIINKYNEDVFIDRMNELMYKAVSIVEKEKINKLHIFNLSDVIDGILRVSQLQSLQYGIIDSVIKFSEFMAVWLNKLSEHVDIEYYQCWGNHDEIRVLTGKKGDFPNENVNRLIMHIIEIRLMDNKNIIIHNKDMPFILANILGVNVFGLHGECKNLPNALKDYQMLYNKDIDLMVAGHLHSSSLETVAMSRYSNVECIRVPSICGIDDFSVKLIRSAKAGCKFFIIESKIGKSITYDIILN